MKNPTYYETMYILRPDIPEDEVNTHIKKYSEILEKAKAEIIDNQMRGKRRLAYSIGKHKEGIYVQLSHKGDGKQVEVIEKSMRLSEDVIRYLTVKQYGAIPAKRTPKATDKDNEKEIKDIKDVENSKDVKEKNQKEEVKKEVKEEVKKEVKEEVKKEVKEEIKKEVKE